MSAALQVAEQSADGHCTDVVLVGVGSIGRELLTQLSSTKKGVSSKLRVCALVDSTGYVLDPSGLSRRTLLALCDHKRHGHPLHEAPTGQAADPLNAVAFIAAQLSGKPVLIDATAADTRAMLEIVLERGWDVILANKVPIAGEQTLFDRLYATARQGGGEILHEATVGAGLPVIDTLRKLVESGDRVQAIEGCPSGTLGFLFGQLGRGASFSEALCDAIAAGYTEPDPRIDLSGLDVARKALILARIIGFRGDLNAVRTESLVPAELRDVSRGEFLARASELDAPWAARVDAARTRGAVLRYRAKATRRGVRVGLEEVPVTHPLSLLEGTDNQFSFTTARYDANPLVITGPGAGAAVTAAGVFNDLLRVVAERARRVKAPAYRRAPDAQEPATTSALGSPW